jgi:6-pyruvoyltetrahydropterin/6-carboxytetrahydropterin synthase
MRAYFGRRYRLSASHRLHSSAFTDAENYAIYGKCNNPYGHGHNYVVEVIVGGNVDPATGMVCDLVQLDACVRKEILDRFDHTNLNMHASFQATVPTTENFNIEVHRLLAAAFTQAEIVSVRIEETSNNSFEYPVHALRNQDSATQQGKANPA